MSAKNISEVETAVEITNQIEDVGIPQIVQTPENRKPFIKKVSAISAFMFIGCLLIAAILLPEIQTFDQSIVLLIFVCSQILWFVQAILPGCFRVLRQRSPYKWILISIFTACSGLFLAANISFYSFMEVIVAFGLTFLVSTLSILYATYTKNDFTTCNELVCRLSLVSYACLFVVLESICFRIPIPFFRQIYCILVAALRTFILIMDFQLIYGKHRISVTVDEYIFCAITFFANIFQIFVFILATFGNGGGYNILISMIRIIWLAFIR